LAVGHFAAKTPGFRGWICLDFLGFSRPNRDLSMGYTGKIEENFCARLLPCVSLAGGPSMSQLRPRQKDS
jgi:hypothetical protein